MEDVKVQSRYDLVHLFGRDAFYDTLEDVLNAYWKLEQAEAQ